jgi:hypothetical protein
MKEVSELQQALDRVTVNRKEHEALVAKTVKASSKLVKSEEAYDKAVEIAAVKESKALDTKVK